MSVWVGRFPICSPVVAAPCGTASPNVAQPDVRPTVATAGACPLNVDANPMTSRRMATVVGDSGSPHNSKDGVAGH